MSEKKLNIEPLQEFLSKDITPAEFCEYLDAIYHQCAISAIKENNDDQETVGGLYYLHRFKKTLQKC